MSHYFIKQLTIEGFRGINNENDPLVLDFKPDRVNSVFAPNSQGKSSIFEALCFLIKGHIPKLSTLHAAERPDDYYSNLFHSRRTASIQLSLEPEDGTPPVTLSVVRNPDGTRSISSPSGHPEPTQLLSSLDNDFCLLDHRTFLSFVEDSPLDRGRSFASLLGLRAISEMRQVLEVLSHTGTLNRDLNIATLQTRVDALSRRKMALDAQLRTSFRNLTGRALEQEIDLNAVISIATSSLLPVPLLAPILQGHTIANVSFDLLRSAIRDAERSDLQDRLRLLSAHSVELQALAPLQVDIDEFELIRSLTRQRESALSTTRGPLLRAHYQTAIQVLQSPEWLDPAICPTCDVAQEQPLPPRLAQKLEQYTTVDALSRQISADWSRGHIGQKLTDLFSSPRLSLDAGIRAAYNSVASSMRNGETAPAQCDDLARMWNQAEAIRLSALNAATQERDTIQNALPPSLVSLTEQVSFAEEVARIVEELASNDRERTILSERLAIRNRWTQFIHAASEVFANAEVALSTSKTTDLEQQCRSMYSSITGNSAIVPRLVKNPGSEELHLTLDQFYGLRHLSARALLSESHRNAFALSIFLSAALQAPTTASFVVLDDVTSSFDSGHQFALMELLRTSFARTMNPRGPQLVILSHDTLLEKYFDRISCEAPWFHQRIHGSSPNGLLFLQSQDANRIKTNANQLINAGQADLAAPLVRQYLEFILLEIIRKVSIPVPLDFSIRDDRRMAQNCIDAIQSAIDLETRAHSLVLSQRQLQQLTTVFVPALVANWVSHYSTGGTFAFIPTVLTSVIMSVDNVADCFKYDCHCLGGVQRRYYRTLSSRACQC